MLCHHVEYCYASHFIAVILSVPMLKSFTYRAVMLNFIALSAFMLSVVMPNDMVPSWVPRSGKKLIENLGQLTSARSSTVLSLPFQSVFLVGFPNHKILSNISLLSNLFRPLSSSIYFSTDHSLSVSLSLSVCLSVCLSLSQTHTFKTFNEYDQFLMKKTPRHFWQVLTIENRLV